VTVFYIGLPTNFQAPIFFVNELTTPRSGFAPESRARQARIRYYWTNEAFPDDGIQTRSIVRSNTNDILRLQTSQHPPRYWPTQTRTGITWIQTTEVTIPP